MALSAEQLEASYPVRVEQSELRIGSGGAGRWRGGLSMLRRTMILADDARYSLLSDRAVMPPFGIANGGCAANNRFGIERDGSLVEFDTPGKVSGVVLARGDVVLMAIAGGGGYGDPLERDPAQVRADLEDGIVTQDDAQNVFGVRLDPDNDVDLSATEARREELASARIHGRASAASSSLYEGIVGSHRICPLSAQMAKRLGAKRDDIIVLRGRGAAPIRGWAVIDASLEEDAIPLDEFALRILQLSPGEQVWVESLPGAVSTATTIRTVTV
jgi:N-methylhydantoinase B